MKDFIRKLRNPKTQEYNILKEEILSMNFTWTYKGSTDPSDNIDTNQFTSNPVYQHCIVAGADVNPEFLIPRVESKYAELVFVAIRQILDANNIEYTQIHRCVVNQIHYWDGKPSPPHLDHHTFFHRNCLIYLNSFDKGEISLYDEDGELMESYKPYEDDIVTFDGYNHSVHQCEPMQRRVVIVFTYS